VAARVSGFAHRTFAREVIEARAAVLTYRRPNLGARYEVALIGGKMPLGGASSRSWIGASTVGSTIRENR
jgi:hypothetical protein